ncbi:ABC transporter substrate-binding protein [Sulfolobus tengchongensis]|uniref:ABC transporter substrate-binding protein n=1 Tax=Sulfolobus tengchongensis TaxID=207809 RepID=A0AAX4L4L8_9CREN
MVSAKVRKAISRTLAIVIAVIIIIVAIGAGLGYYYSSRTTPVTTTTTSTSTLPISTTPITIGAVSASHPDMAAWAFMENNISSIIKQYDPNINFEDFPAGSSAVIHAVESGTVQIGIAGTDAIVVAISQGAPLVILATFRVTPAIRYVVVKSTSNITSLAQLNGTTSANSAPGSLDTIALEYLELTHHLHFKISYVGSFSAQIAAVVSGAATFTNIGSFDAPKLIENGTLRVIYNFTYAWPMFSIFTTKSFLQQNPTAVKAAVMAILKGDQIYEENLNNETVKFLINYYKNIMEPSYAYNVLFKQVVFSTNGAINATAIQVLINTYRELGIITNTTITANDTYTDEFVPVIT